MVNPKAMGQSNGGKGVITIVLIKIPKIIAKILFIVCALLLVLGLISARTLPKFLLAGDTNDIDLPLRVPLTAKANTPIIDGSYTASVNLFGIIPIGQTQVTIVDDDYVVVGGTPFGIKIMSQGVLVVGFNDIPTQSGYTNPAKKAGLKEGDIVLAINNQTVSTNARVQELVEQSAGDPMTLSVQRNGVNLQLTLIPALAPDGKYRAGMWVRDSAAGLGTMTFYHPASGMYGGLGHSVCDSDTGQTVSLLTGEIVTANIIEVKKAVSGRAGAIVGTLNSKQSLGDILCNSEQGIFGRLDKPPASGQTMAVAHKQQVTTGSAQILSCVDGTTRAYSCEIESITLKSDSSQNLVIRITDQMLLSQTGGIVQGMSGSPIIQNGKLVGAVTHVFLNQPEKGYGIFAENMLETAQSVAEDQELKEVS